MGHDDPYRSRALRASSDIRPSAQSLVSEGNPGSAFGTGRYTPKHRVEIPSFSAWLPALVWDAIAEVVLAAIGAGQVASRPVQ